MDIDQAGRIREQLKKNRVVVVAGFQGLNPNEDIATLGRGGLGHHGGGAGGCAQGGPLSDPEGCGRRVHHQSAGGAGGAQAG
jgi:hypothetical protein